GAIAAGNSSFSETTPYYYDYTESSLTLAQRGYLYNWPAVMHGASSSSANPSGVQGICPTGWHLPSDAEWTQLTNYVKNHSQYVCGSNSNYIAKALAATTGWNSSTTTCAVGNTPSSNNATGFGAMPAGALSLYSSFYGSGIYACFCSSTESGSLTAYQWSLGYAYADVTRSSGYSKNHGLSVRCVRDSLNGDTITQTQPNATTFTATNITTTSATLNGTISNPDNVTITAQGFEWKVTQGGTYTAVNAMGTTMSHNLTSLASNTSYTYRAFVTTAAGTSYGGEVTFTTTASISGVDAEPCPGTLIDIDGNTYNTVWIGNQCWMKENLRTTKYADGTSIALGSIMSTITANRYYPNNDPSNVSTYGYLYNWKAVMRNSSSSSMNPSGVQGICPTGWHVPSDAEWTQLTDYVGAQSQYQCNGSSTNIAKALASTTGWETSSNTCAVGNNQSSNNVTGFNAFPAGIFGDDYYLGQYGLFGSSAFYWSSTESYSDSAWIRVLVYDYAGVLRFGDSKTSGFSVRCVRDSLDGDTTIIQIQPTVTTLTTSNITTTSATLNGTVTNPNNLTITAQGFEWKTTQGGAYTIVSATGTSISYNLTGLASNTSYTYRAFVTTVAGTNYGGELTFTTTASISGVDAEPCPGTPTVTDIDGNTYNTVWIGNQCWMKENLRTTKYADGTSIALGSTTSQITAYRYYPNNDSSNVSTYGYLYNRKAVMRNSYSSHANPSGVQGICPTGWHVPSYAEWTQLTDDYVGHQSDFQCDGSSYSYAKALASTTGWETESYYTCAVGANQSSNNATGFSAFPAGYYGGVSGFVGFGHDAFFWSSTEDGINYAWGRVLHYWSSYVHPGYISGTQGCSVRCVRD
ncbi:MAG: fibrobacter succinogenes major paralogous domain-containing protein, partial [Bacteroidales bacterium]|nr:fibrobacter succinogenes major paralogous domain-containing protein [Bacteroidales bacterium]